MLQTFWPDSPLCVACGRDGAFCPSHHPFSSDFRHTVHDVERNRALNILLAALSRAMSCVRDVAAFDGLWADIFFDEAAGLHLLHVHAVSNAQPPPSDLQELFCLQAWELIAEVV